MLTDQSGTTDSGAGLTETFDSSSVDGRGSGAGIAPPQEPYKEPILVPPTVAEQIKKLFEDFAAGLFNQFGEPEVLVMLPIWNIGKSYFPLAFTAPRNPELHPNLLLEIAQAAHRLNDRMQSSYNNNLLAVINAQSTELQKLKVNNATQAAAGAS